MLGKYALRYSTLTTLLLLTVLLLSACGGDPAVDATLPTLVPTYSPAAADAAPTAVAAATVVAAATLVVAAPTATTAPSATPPEAPTATPSPAPTDAPTTTPTSAPTATAAPTITPTTEGSATAPTDLQGATAIGSAAATSTLTVTTTITATTTDPAPTTLLPTDLAAALATADPVHGQELSVSNGCIACHALGEGQVLVGPAWYGVGAYAATRVAGESAEEYLYRSIVAPNDHLVEGFIAGLMPQVYADTIATDDLADIISYLLSLQ